MSVQVQTECFHLIPDLVVCFSPRAWILPVVFVESTIEHLRWNFFAKLVNGWNHVTIFAKKFHRRCSNCSKYASAYVSKKFFRMSMSVFCQATTVYWTSPNNLATSSPFPLFVYLSFFPYTICHKALVNCLKRFILW